MSHAPRSPDDLSLAALKAALAQLRDEGDPSLLQLAISMRASFSGQPARLLRVLSTCNGEMSDIAGLITFVELGSTADALEDARFLLELAEVALSAKIPRFNDYLQELVEARSLARGKSLMETAESLEDVQAILEEALSVSVARPQKTHPILYIGDPAVEAPVTVAEPLVEGLLFPGYTVASGRWKKARKTTFFLAMSFAIQSGTHFCGRQTRKSRCAWIERDMTVGNFVFYSREIRQGLGLGPTAIPFIAEPMDLTKPVDQRCLVEAMKAAEAEVVFIDSARAVARVEENSSDEVSGFTRDFLCAVLRDQLGISVVLIGHPSKQGPGGMRGSGDWEAGADNILTFNPCVPEGKNEAAYIGVLGEGRHEAVDFNFRVDNLSQHGGGWVVLEVDQDERAALKAAHQDPERSPEARILSWLGKNSGSHAARKIERGARLRSGLAPRALINLMSRGEVTSSFDEQLGTSWSLSEGVSPCPLSPPLKGWGDMGDTGQDTMSPGQGGQGGDKGDT